jgi:hypothetical protein
MAWASGINPYAAILLIGVLGAGSYATKAANWAAINVSPEPFTNILASLVEGILVFVGFPHQYSECAQRLAIVRVKRHGALK